MTGDRKKNRGKSTGRTDGDLDQTAVKRAIRADVLVLIVGIDGYETFGVLDFIKVDLQSTLQLAQFLSPDNLSISPALVN